MRRIFLIAISIIIGFIAFTFLWTANPLYAFVGGVVFIVFMIIALGLIINQPVSRSAPNATPPTYDPRRRGEVRELPAEERPEGDWNQETLVDARISPPQQQFGGVSEPAVIAEPDKKANPNKPEPKPVPPPAPPSTELDFDDAVLIDEEENEETVIPDIQGEIEPEPTMEELDDMYSDDSESASTFSETQFSAYYPRQAAANTDYGFYVYAHLPDALINIDVQQFSSDLGGRIPKAKVADEHALIEDRAMLTAMVHCDNLKFNQMGVMQQWQAPFTRFDFRFTADEAFVDDLVTGRIAILMGLIEIASIDFQIMVTPANPIAMLDAIPTDPLTASHYDASATSNLYQKIFISYSRKDTVIAEQYRAIQMMAGNIVFMDTHSIRAGEDWEVALKRFIDDADVFQLFWSSHSAQSDHVKFEWDYALQQRCPETKCVQFIRPTYWEKPLADIPEALGHLHFAFISLDLSNPSE